MHQMFNHAAATGQKEHNLAICWGWWQPSPIWDLGVESSTMDLIGPETSWAKIRVIYNDVYQLWRLPGKSLCDKETGGKIHQEILDSIKEHLWHMWVPTQAEEELSSTSTSKTDAQGEFQARTWATYDHLKTCSEIPAKTVLATVRYAHWWVLAPMTLLEENIKWLSHSVTLRWSGSHRLSGNCRHRSQSAGCPTQAPGWSTA